MTTTKEDQMRAEFEEVHAGANFTKSMLGYYIDIDVAEKWISWQACAESYEKKLADCVAATASIHNLHVALEKSYTQRLAEKDAALKAQQDDLSLFDNKLESLQEQTDNDVMQARAQLSEANARNAMLVEALKVEQRHLHHGITRAEHDEIDGAISANSEAINSYCKQ